jgi:hypothetical protein
MSEIIKALSAPFTEHGSRSGGGGMTLHYVAIDQMLNRANEVLGMAWNSELVHFEDTDGTCKIVLSLTVIEEGVGGTTRLGVGGSDMKDTDDRLKTALAEALKKALNQFGMGLYLWDDVEREAALATPVNTLVNKKAKLLEHWLTQNEGVEPTAQLLMDYYGVDDFDDEVSVDELLADYGLDG